MRARGRWRLVFLALGVVLAAAAVRAGSRGVLVSLIGAALLAGVLLIAHSRRPFATFALIAVFGAAVAEAGRQVVSPAALNRYTRLTNDPRRGYLHTRALEQALAHPLGNGIGTFGLNLPVINPRPVVPYPHNVALEIFNESGIFALGAFVIGSPAKTIKSTLKVFNQSEVQGAQGVVGHGQLVKLLAGSAEHPSERLTVSLVTFDPGVHEKLHWHLIEARRAWRDAREGAYLLRTNLVGQTVEELWTKYIQLTEAEAAFRALKSELAVRPVFHQLERRAKAHLLVAFLGYALWVTLKHLLHRRGTGLTPARALALFATLQSADIILPTTDGREIRLRRVTQPTPEQQQLLDQLEITIPTHLEWNAECSGDFVAS